MLSKFCFLRLRSVASLSFLIFLAPLCAQYTTGRLEGSIIDPAGAAVTQVRVSLRSPQTGVTREITTGAAGEYFFAAIAPGAYRITVEAPGFRGVETGLTISTSETQTLDFHLEVAGQQASVQVSADADMGINAFEPLRAVTRNTLDVEMLPNNGRSIVNMITLAPGVTPTFNPRGGNLTTLSIAQAGQLNANGGRSKATAHQLDFTDANDWEYGGIALSTQPSPDMLQEFKILTNNWAAEYGLKSSAEVLMVTKSGTNDLHGSGYDFLQNSALNARDYYDRSGSATPMRQNMYGVTAGGAIKRDRLFLFGGWESRRTRGSSPVTIANVLTQSARDSVTDANIKSIIQLMPLPTASTSDSRIGTVAVSAPTPSDSDMYLLRGDATLSERHTLTARYFENTGTSYNRTAGSLPGFDATFDPKGRNAMVAETWVVNAQTTNELRLSYGRASALFSPEDSPATPRYSVAGLVGFGTVQSWPQGRIFNVYQLNDVASSVHGRHIFKAGLDLREIQDNSVNDSSRRGVYTFANVSGFLAGQASGYSQMFGNTYRGFRTHYHGAFLQDDWRVTPRLTLNLGLRAEFQGGLTEVNQLQSVLDPSLSGTIGNAGTGALGAFRNAKPSVYGNNALVAPRFGFAWTAWRDRFVVRGGYGIYYDSQIFNGLQAGRYTPPTNYTGTLSGAAISGANSLSNLLAGTSQIQQTLGAQAGNFGSLQNLGSIVSSLPNLPNPYVQQFSLGTQARLARTLSLDLAYVGTRGVKLTTYGPGNSVDPSKAIAPAITLADESARLTAFKSFATGVNGEGNPRLDARFNDVSLLRGNGSSTYHSLQMGLRKSLSTGLQMQLSYTWSKSIDNASDYSPGQTTNDRSFAQHQFDTRSERAVSAFDIPHRLTLTHVWRLPFFEAQKGLLGHTLGGWTFASINQWQSGIPYTVMSGARLGIPDVNMDGSGSGTLDNVRASCVAGTGFTFNNPSTIPTPSARQVGAGATNTAGFRYIQPLLGNNGTCGRNTERINSLVNFDWTFSKSVRLSEHGPLGSGPWNAELRADLLNVFNVPYVYPSGDDYRNLSSASFGLANSAAASRRVQMALRLTW